MSASCIRQRDVVLAVVNAEPSDSDTSHIRIISEPCKECFLCFFLAIALLVSFITVVAAVSKDWMSTFDSEVGLFLDLNFISRHHCVLCVFFFLECTKGC